MRGPVSHHQGAPCYSCGCRLRLDRSSGCHSRRAHSRTAPNKDSCMGSTRADEYQRKAQKTELYGRALSGNGEPKKLPLRVARMGE